MAKNARLFYVSAFAYMTEAGKSRLAGRPAGETAFFSTVFSTAVEKWLLTAGQAEPDGECNRGVRPPVVRRLRGEEAPKRL